MSYQINQSCNGLKFLAQSVAFVAVFIAVQNTNVPVIEQTLPYQQYQLLLNHPIHGEKCNPETDSQKFPIVDSLPSDKFLYCHAKKRVYDIGFCIDKVFDLTLRKCLAQAIPMEEEQTEHQTTTADSATATSTGFLNSTTKELAFNSSQVPSSFKIFAKDTKQRKFSWSDQKIIGQRMGAFLPEEGGIGTALSIRPSNDSLKTEEANVQHKSNYLEQNDAENVGDEMPREGADVKILIKMANSSENLGKVGKKEKALTEAMGQKIGEDNDGNARRHLVVCSDGSLPFSDNNGRSHRCIPDYGHNPFSSFACPFSYRCEYSSLLRTHQCCPELVDANGEEPIEEEYSEDGKGGQNGPEEGMPNSHILEFGRACPPSHFLRMHPKNGHPTLCSPGWLILTGHGGCPPFSKCVYSPSLLQFVCCQSANLLKAMENELNGQNYALFPQKGIFPAQSGCIDDGQCDLGFPGAKCQNWVCICPLGLFTHNGRCVLNCPSGHSVDESNGICRPKAVGQKRQKHWMFWHKTK